MDTIFFKHKQVCWEWHLPDSLMSSSEATFTLISWLSKLFLAMGLPSLGFSDPGCSNAAAAPAGPSWQKVAGKLGWTWLWDCEDGLGLSASSTLGSSFRWNGDLSVSLWLAAAHIKKRSKEWVRSNKYQRCSSEVWVWDGVQRCKLNSKMAIWTLIFSTVKKRQQF